MLENRFQFIDPAFLGVSGRIISVSSPMLPSQPILYQIMVQSRKLFPSRLRLPYIFSHGEYEERASEFVTHHEETEAQHLAAFDLVLDPRPSLDRSRILPIWRVAGFSLGAVSILWCTRQVVSIFYSWILECQITKLKANARLAFLRFGRTIC